MSYYFNIPSLNNLTCSQRNAINSDESIAVSGGPGTGKSVVSLYRHINLWNNGKHSLLLTYTTTLKLYLEKCCETKNKRASENVETTYRAAYRLRKSYHEIIIDEAQDVSIDVYNMLADKCKYISFGADESQSLYPENGTSYSELYEFVDSVNNSYLTECLLDSNFRNTKAILRFTRQAFPRAKISLSDINNSMTPEGNMPILFVTNESKYQTSSESQDNTIIEILGNYAESGHNIAILCPWAKYVDYFYNIIKNDFDDVTYYYSRDNSEYGINEIGSIHITTFKSAKGLEFDTVIIPNFDRAFENFDPKFHIDWNDFYVGCCHTIY